MFSFSLKCILAKSPISNVLVGSYSTSNEELVCNPDLSSSHSFEFFDSFSADNNNFYIQGWKWHTLSLLRDSKRLEKLANSLLSSPSSTLRINDLNSSPQPPDDALEKAASHVVDFNMKGLHRIEDELFFPWLKEKLFSHETSLPKEVQPAFQKIISELEDDRKYVSKLGTTLKEEAKIASLPNLEPRKRLEALRNVSKMSAALTSKTRGLLQKEERYIIPTVAFFVPANEQKSFNKKVIRKLGILDSRLHLVGMYDAVFEKGDDNECKLFNSTIPQIMRMMIPRWRRLLYEPQAGTLNGF